MLYIINYLLILVLLLFTTCSKINSQHQVKTVTASSSTQAAKTVVNSNQSKSIIIKSGDTLTKIANRYKIKITDIANYNHLTIDSKLNIGQILHLPTINYYKVKPVDNLITIAKLFNLEIGVIARANKLKPPYKVMVNQLLIIPADYQQKEINQDKVQTVKSIELTKIISGDLSDNQKKTPSNINKKMIQIVKKQQFIWPVKGKIINHFSNKNDGINILAKLGTPILAIADGLVIYSGNDIKDYGNLLVLKHKDNFLSAYAHQRNLIAYKNQQVKQGQIIGYIGQSGKVSKSQLHFAMKRDKNPIDPQYYLGK